jgi:epoxyqueuosine reductase
MLQQLLKALQTVHPELQGRAFVDSAPLLEKQLAVEAGLGWIGRQSLLVTPEFGSYVLLGELVLSGVADRYDTPYSGVGCGECRRCIDACPTGAIVAPMTINTAACISCRTIESENEKNIDLHGWIFGCDECQNSCPYNKRAALHRNSNFNPLFDPREISAEQWLSMSDEEFLARFGTTPLKRSGLERIKQNIKKVAE